MQDPPDIDFGSPAFHSPAHRTTEMTPIGDLKWWALSCNSRAALKLTLNHLENVEASIPSQKGVDWMIEPVDTETAN